MQLNSTLPETLTINYYGLACLFQSRDHRKFTCNYLSGIMSSASTPLRDRLQDHYDELVSQLMPAYYINFLFAKRALSPLDKDNLEGIKQQIAQAKCFVDILLKKDESSIMLFLDYLKTKRDGQPQLYRLLFPEV